MKKSNRGVKVKGNTEQRLRYRKRTEDQSGRKGDSTERERTTEGDRRGKERKRVGGENG